MCPIILSNYFREKVLNTNPAVMAIRLEKRSNKWALFHCLSDMDFITIEGKVVQPRAEGLSGAGLLTADIAPGVSVMTHRIGNA